MRTLHVMALLAAMTACGGGQKPVGGHMVSFYSCEPEEIFKVAHEEVAARFDPIDFVDADTYALSLVHWHNEYGRRLKKKDTSIRPGFVNVEIMAKVHPDDAGHWVLELREVSHTAQPGTPAGAPIPPGHADRPSWLDQRMQSLRDAIYQRLAHCATPIR